MSKTFMQRKEDINRKWYVVDAAEIPVGRLSTEVATILMGKNKPTYTPHVDCGDHVIVINCEKVALTGKKMDQKLYRRHSGYAGGLKEVRAKDVLVKTPERVVRHSVKGMLPKNKLGRNMLKKLHIVVGENHDHDAQKPETLTVGGNK